MYVCVVCGVCVYGVGVSMCVWCVECVYVCLCLCLCVCVCLCVYGEITSFEV